jgi:hypothetical protein
MELSETPLNAKTDAIIATAIATPATIAIDEFLLIDNHSKRKDGKWKGMNKACGCKVQTCRSCHRNHQKLLLINVQKVNNISPEF